MQRWEQQFYNITDTTTSDSHFGVSGSNLIRRPSVVPEICRDFTPLFHVIVSANGLL
jgi:hypothetical protein